MGGGGWQGDAWARETGRYVEVASRETGGADGEECLKRGPPSRVTFRFSSSEILQPRSLHAVLPSPIERYTTSLAKFAPAMFVLRLAFLAGLAEAGRVTMEEGNAARASNDWLVHSRCPPDTSLPLTLVLRKESAQLAALEDVFWAVSDPSSPRYGEHLNATQLAALIGASDAAIAEVVAWLRREGATHTNVAATRDAIEASLSCAAAERAFDTRLSTLRHARAGHLAIHRATAPYSLPDAIARHVALVGELIAVPLLRTPLPASNATQLVEEREGGFPAADSCGGKCRSTFVTPAVLSKAYNLGAAPSSAQGSLAVAEFQGVKYDDADLQAYSSACGVDLKVTDVGSAEGFKCRIPLLGTELCGEALLDIEYAGALAGAIPLTDIFNSQFSLLKWATQISNMASPPLVHSVSYGNDEAQQSSKTFMEECNTQFMKLGAMGLSILFASGDQGVLGREGSGSRYHPDFPAASPYITAVGGTDFVTTGVIGAEKAWSQGGGGFSDAFPMPAYQKEAVEAYLASPDLPPSDKMESLWPRLS
ncbi:hypothetical protein AB1Y20_012985 [Prymnesium parvum]|uniref:Peptidase S53 domain-containing protein n=1 Tax=Prymnesium parvum TaxID=97485 RepID=A0AB34IJD9_PRYPA